MVAFVVARLTSSRLPAKQLRPIGDRPLIQWTIDELRRCRRLDEIVVTTVDEPENEPLQEFCRERGLECFWYEGDVNHVTTRLRRAAELYRADIGVLVSGDCPLLQAEAIDSLVAGLAEAEDGDYVQIVGQGGAPGLEGIVIGRLRAWQLADDLANRPELKEHQFPLLGQRPDLFHPVRLVLPREVCLPYHRLSVDTVADLEFFSAIWRRLQAAGREFNLREAVRLLKESPELRKINGHVHQRTVNERPRKVLCLLDAGGSYGFGHLMRCAELGRQIVERLSWPVRFVVDDDDAAAGLSELGFVVSWGAFGRPARPSARSIPTFENHFGAYDLVIVDIFDQRDPGPGWRQRFNLKGCVAAVENFREWSKGADLLIGPNVLGKGRELQGDGRRVIEGPSYLILRREVRLLWGSNSRKDIDLLAYLHDPRQREQIRFWAHAKGIRLAVPEEFSSDFLANLSRSRMFLSGFGTSFYEAVSLQSIPVCLPDSGAHRADAERFYGWLGVSPLILESVSGLDGILGRIDTADPPIELPVVDDGTPRIIEELRALVESRQHLKNL